MMTGEQSPMSSLKILTAIAATTLVMIIPIPALRAQGNNVYSSFAWTGFFEDLQASAASTHVAEDAIAKKPDRGKPFQDIRKDGGFLVGFEFTNGDWFGTPLIQSMQPIYLTAKGKDPGQRRGNLGHDPFKIEARDGYAVSSVTIHGGDPFIMSIQVTFMKIDLLHRALDPTHTYTSEVHGDVVQHPEWTPDKQIGGTAPIIGWVGYAENEINAFTLVQAASTP
jgi:hypothetical protein